MIYDVLARRLAQGLGYTWAWPDGAVTAVAHYPVGYPALLALAYRCFGPAWYAPLILHAVLGALGAAAVHVVAAEGADARSARFAGLAVALHPALLAYQPALMTEGVCAALLALPFATVLLAARARSPSTLRTGCAAAGALLAIAVLVRPQTLLLLPMVGWLGWRAGAASRGLRRSILPALVLAGTVAVVAPWTVRNASAFGEPVLVSANGGWNLLIGTDPEAHGTWRALEAPTACREVWGEATKDACFGSEARRRIRQHPLAWLSLVPSKLAATFDLAGSGLSYLSRALPGVVPRWAVVTQGGVETVFERTCLLVLLLAEARAWRGQGSARLAVAAIGLASLLTPYAWVGYVALAALLLWPDARGERPALRAVTCGVLGATVAVHAVYFGASRYGLLVQPWVAGMAGACAFRSAVSPGASSARLAS